PAFIVSAFISWFIPAAALVAGYVFYLHTRAVREQVDAAELQRAALEKQQLETQLCLLQAQIEPHFLFNTLSNVRRLCQSDAGAGRAMLAQLARYLRAALPRMRDHEVSLADEIELVSAFLGVQKIRMGARLESSIDVPAPLLEARVPSMMLATLVENATKHGIGPLAEGGAIRVAAARDGETLVLSAVIPLSGALFKLAVDPASHHGAVVGEVIVCFVIGLAAMLSVIATENRLAGVLGPAPRMAIAVLVAAIAGTVLMEAATQL